MNTLVQVETKKGVGVIVFDDGKVNCINPAMATALSDAFDSVSNEGIPVLITGRTGRFCAGFETESKDLI